MIKKIYQLRVWKKRPFQIFTVPFLLLILYLTINIAMPCREYLFEGSHAFEQGVSTQETVLYDEISLRPGVYRIRLEYQTDRDMVSLCNVKDGTVFFDGLLSNGEPLYSGLSETGYTMWLYESTEQMQVVVSYGGEGSLTTGNLTITETNQLWTMLLTIVIFIGVLFYSSLIFYYYDSEYGVLREKKHAFFWVMAITLIASTPYLCGYSITGADLTYHLQRIEGVKDGLLGGQFPVRLEPRWVYDHGYANAVFYCNTFLYLPALLRMLGFTVTAAYNVYGVAISAATAWIAYYCFGRMFGNRNIGILCSALYTLSIFRIYKLTGTGTVGEGSAVTFMPLVIYGLYRIFAQDPKDKNYVTAWVPLALGLTGLIQTHVLSCEITAGVMILFCLIFIRRIFCRRTFLALAKAAVSTLALNLWFLVPFLDYYLTQDVHIKFVSARTIQERGLYPAQLAFHFWRTSANISPEDGGMQYSHPVGIGLTLAAALGIFLILWFSGKFQKHKDGCVSFVKVTALAGILLLFMSLNVFPWDRIQSLHPVVATLVSSLQFPNRFLGWGTVCTVTALGGCLWYFERQDMRFYWGMAAFAVLGVMTSGMYLLDHVNRDQDYYELYNEEGMGFGYISGAEYLIQGTDESLLTFSGPAAGEGVEIDQYEKDYLNIDFHCVNNADSESFVDLPLLLYKGYLAVNVDQGERMSLCADDNQEIRVVIPAHFEGNVRVRFVSPFYWRLSEGISVIAVVWLAVIGWRCRRRRLC